MIEREDGRVTVTLGDGDVKIGINCFKSFHPMVRLYMSPLPSDWGHGLNTVVPMPEGDCNLPADAAVEVFFLERANLDSLIDALTRARDRSFPLPVTPPQGDVL